MDVISGKEQGLLRWKIGLKFIKKSINFIASHYKSAIIDSMYIHQPACPNKYSVRLLGRRPVSQKARQSENQ